MAFDLETAIPVRERPDGLLEKDTFDLSTAVPISEPPKPVKQNWELLKDPSFKEDWEVVKSSAIGQLQDAYTILGAPVKWALGMEVEPLKEFPKLWEVLTTPRAIPPISARNIKSVLTGKGITETTEGVAGDLSILDGLFIAWGGSQAMKAFKGNREFNQGIDKLISQEKIKTAEEAVFYNITKDLNKYEKIFAEGGKFPEGVDNDTKAKVIMEGLNNNQNLKTEVFADTLLRAKGIDPKSIIETTAKVEGFEGSNLYGKLKRINELVGERGSIPLIRAKPGQKIIYEGRPGTITKVEGQRIELQFLGEKTTAIATLSQLSLPPTEAPKVPVEAPETPNKGIVEATEGKVIPEELKPLVEEAKKYKSAEDFINNINKGRNQEYRDSDLNESYRYAIKDWVGGKKQIQSLIKDYQSNNDVSFDEAYEALEPQILKIQEEAYNRRDKILTDFYNKATSKLSTPPGEGQKPPVEPPKTIEPSLQALETKPPEPPIQKPPEITTPPGITPPEPPPEPSMPQEPDPVKQVIQALKEAKPIRAEQEALMKAERGRRIAKAKAMGENIGGEAGFRAQLGSLKGELPKAQFETLRGKIDQPTIDTLFNKIRESELNDWDKIGAQTGLGKLFGEFGGQVPTEGELKLLNDIFGKEFTDALITHRTTLQKFLLGAEQVLNIPRTIMASFDLSAPLRQGAFLIGKPQQFGPAFVEMFKYFGSEKAFAGLNQEIAARPTFKLMKEHKLALTDLGTPLTTREEQFMSNWAEKIPLVGMGVRASGRAYTGFLNKLRADVFDDLYGKAKSLGIEETDKFLNDLTEFINAATGRGKLPGKLDKAAVALNSIFFSPRLMASRISLLNPQFYTSKEPFVRKEALKSLLTFAGAALTILGLAALGGAEVGTDWRSSDFLKIKIGNTRVDVWAGFQQYLRMTGQLITGQYVSSTTGKKMTLGEGYKPLTRYDIVLRQLENKEAPVASFITAILRQQTFMGEKVKITKEIATRFTPMVLGNFIELANEDPKLLPLGIAGLFGVGVQSYKPRKSKKL